MSEIEKKVLKLQKQNALFKNIKDVLILLKFNLEQDGLDSEV
jgi:hypothetical protein